MTTTPQPAAELSDEQIESTLQRCGGKWDGSRWVIEDADLHPFVRTVIAAAPPNPQALPELPPLPEPTLEGVDYELWGQNVKGDFYTAEQMRAYGLACMKGQS